MSDAFPRLDEARSAAIELIQSGRPFLMTLTPLPFDGETQPPAPISCVAAPVSNLSAIVYGMGLHFHLAHDLVKRSVQLVGKDFPGGEVELTAHINWLLERFTQMSFDVDGHARVIPPTN